MTSEDDLRLRIHVLEVEKEALLAVRGFDRSCADALADEVAVLVLRKEIDARSPAADALLDYRNPPSTPRADRLAELEAACQRMTKFWVNPGLDGEGVETARGWLDGIVHAGSDVSAYCALVIRQALTKLTEENAQLRERAISIQQGTIEEVIFHGKRTGLRLEVDVQVLSTLQLGLCPDPKAHEVSDIQKGSKNE